MTVGDKVHQALASLRSLEGQFEMFALDTNDNQAKQMYNQCRQQIHQMVQQLSSRTNYMEQQEPTYKIGGNQGNQMGMNTGMTGGNNTMGTNMGTTTGTTMGTNNKINRTR